MPGRTVEFQRPSNGPGVSRREGIVDGRLANTIGIGVNVGVGVGVADGSGVGVGSTLGDGAADAVGGATPSGVGDDAAVVVGVSGGPAVSFFAAVIRAADVPAIGTKAVLSALQARVNMMVRTTIRGEPVSYSLPKSFRIYFLASGLSIRTDIALLPDPPSGNDYCFDFLKSRISATKTVSQGTLRLFN